MKKLYIKEIKEKEQVAGAFLVTKKETGVSKTGKPYLNLKIMDSTGELDARIWDNAEELGRNFQKNDVVSIKGFAVAYQGGLQLNISSVSALPEGEYSIRDFLPCSLRDPAEMLVELDSVIERIRDRHLKALLTSIFSEPDIREKFSTAPAAKSMHHPYLGGLIEHVLSICGLAGKVAEHYNKGVNKDLLIAGAILHDIGKVWELSYARSFEYTDEGRLLGHITIGVELIERHAGRIEGFPRELSVLLKHMLLSHHGHLEFGSPKRPKTIEALILYYLDDMDAKVNTIQTLIEEDKEGGPGWTPYLKIFERYIYKSAFKSEEGAKEAPKEEEGPLKDEKSGGFDNRGNSGMPSLF